MTDDDEELESAEFAFVWACVTIAAIGFLALAGWAYKTFPWAEWLS